MINLFHRFLSNWFGFNKQQRNGLLVLCFVIVVLFLIRISLHHMISPKPIMMVDLRGHEFSETNPTSEVKQGASDSLLKKENALFVFDPNTVTKEQLLKLGFREKTANTFLNYRNKGAKFKRKEDIKKVYGISETLYAKIEPFIFIQSEQEALPKPEQKIDKHAPASRKIIELNTADSLELISLKGIGPGFAKRILKYRALLGGYNNVEQLKEVYGMPDSTYEAIRAFVKADPALVTKLNLNNENFKELNKHPYLSYESVKAIFNFRRKNGPINSIDQLQKCITDEYQLQKLKPYLPF